MLSSRELGFAQLAQRMASAAVAPVVHGMQEVSGSSPLSSTGQKRNSNGSNSEYSRKVQQRQPVGPPYVFGSRIFPRARLRRTADSIRRTGVGQSVTCANRPVLGPVTLVTASLSGHPGGAIPASDCCRICRWSRRVTVQWSDPLPAAASADRVACSPVERGKPGLCVLRRVVPSGAGASRRAPLRRGNCVVAQSGAHVGAVLRHMRDQARRGARDLARHRPPATRPADGRLTEPGSRRRAGAVRAAQPQTALYGGREHWHRQRQGHGGDRR